MSMHDYLKILAVDDDPGVLNVFKTYFEHSDQYSIVTASDGPSALDVFSKEQPDFLFTDLAMPGMDGIALSKRILEMDNTIPIVVMTAYPSMESTIMALQTGVSDFIVKPFKIRDVDFIIEKVMAQKEIMVENLLLKSQHARKKELEKINMELAATVEEMEKLNFILRKVDWKKNSGELFDQLTNISCEISGGHLCYFQLLDDSTGSLYPLAHHAVTEELDNEDVPDFLDALAKQSLDKAGPAIWGKDPASGLITPLHAAVAIPFNIKDKPLGAITVCKTGPGNGFSEQDLHYLSFLGKRAALVVENTALYENLCQNLFSTLYAFVEAIEARDPYTKQHSARVADISCIIGEHLGCSARELDLLDFSGKLHDIGKIGVRDKILLKEAQLDEEEFRIIKTHPEIGANIVGHMGLLKEETQVILHHHERWDGEGYPNKVGGEDIPFLSRIMTVADAFDALTSDRAYRKKVDDAAACEIVKKNAGAQFDPVVAEAFLDLAAQGKVTSSL
ncbi:GAF domain-containing protein [Desulfatibacillum alkenivorans DSM 16219]|uniref:GAF domain-containing protein n=1 Tax=Desulfatibacillum alkenivorans DSM 16219 TaxID=1121393 RepID=A0A1M6Y6L3_9BACT|nr:HD domain-containing phosphohydrolase [Desulfatibacillum alkenivorans]SHL13625.1 GAF domain-containing protein [Desulfatibacillum alkenivorans DSM 16219]